MVFKYILKFHANNNFNKFIIKGKNVGEHAWRIILYMLLYSSHAYLIHNLYSVPQMCYIKISFCEYLCNIGFFLVTIIS